MLTPISFEAVYCFICGLRWMAVARFWMICLVLNHIEAVKNQQEKKNKKKCVECFT